MAAPQALAFREMFISEVFYMKAKENPEVLKGHNQLLILSDRFEVADPDLCSVNKIPSAGNQGSVEM